MNPVPATGPPCGSCGHGKVAHEHYRRGTDCSLCTCAKYRRSWSILARVRGR